MLKVGAVRSMNTLPLFFPLEQGKIDHSIHFVWGDEASINEHLNTGAVDIALISSTHFLENRYRYILLSDLGIAATHSFPSVRLFFRENIFTHTPSVIYLPETSSISTHLLRVLCAQYWSISPQFRLYTNTEEMFSQQHPFLTCDDVGIIHAHLGTWPSLDICEAWFDVTKKSFLFSLIATRSFVFQQRPEEVIAIHRSLEQAYHWSEYHHQEIVQHAACALQGHAQFINQYYTSIDYRLSSKHFHGLHYFLTQKHLLDT